MLRSGGRRPQRADKSPAGRRADKLKCFRPEGVTHESHGTTRDRRARQAELRGRPRPRARLGRDGRQAARCGPQPPRRLRDQGPVPRCEARGAAGHPGLGRRGRGRRPRRGRQRTRRGYWGDDPQKPGREYRILGLPDDGTFAQLVKVPAENVFPKPSHLSHEEAAAIPLGALTAYRALVTRGGVQEGETVVVPGIGSGVATFVVQMAAALGARVFVTSGDDEKIEKAKELGVEGGV